MNTTYNILTTFLLAVSIFMASCGQTESESHDEHNHTAHQEEAVNEDEHAHNEEELIEQHTIYTDSMELYITFPPLVSNAANTITAHLTTLNNYKPVGKGVLELKTGLGESTSTNKAIEEGIFELKFTPKKSGIVYLKFTFNDGNEKTVFIQRGVTIYSDAHQAEHASIAHRDGVEFTKEQSWKTDFAIEKISMQPFSGIIRTSGKIEQALGSDYAVTANHSGIVSFSTKQISEGSEIKKNQLLMSIQSNDMIEDNIQTEYIAAKANYDKYKTDYQRAEKLFEERLITEKDFLDVKLIFEQAKNKYTTLSRNYSEGGNNVIAPVNGFVKQLKVLAGEYVEAGQILAIISQNRRLVIKADVSQKHFSRLSSIKSALFKTDYNSKTHDTNKMNGKLLSYSRSTNNNSFFTSVYFEVDNKGELIPGSFIEIFLRCKESSSSISVFSSAILDEQGQKFVFVQINGELYEKRYVQTGAFDGERVKIVSGLNVGDYVVCKGAYPVKLASVSGGLPAHGHVH